MFLKFDCRHFRFDRPCSPHKLSGVKCDHCQEYDPIQERILIIKLDAAGDVLRTTSLLKPLKKMHPKSHITWITKTESLDLLKNLKEVDAAVPVDEELPIRLATEEFDLVLNPDASPSSARLATFTKAKVKRGFLINEKGWVQPTNSSAQAWFETGIDDQKKRENKKTYQQWLHETLQIELTEHPILWQITDEERSWAKSKNPFRDQTFKLVGLNTGAGGRWKYKKWTLDGYRQLIRRLLDHANVRVILYGGENEDERNLELEKLSPQKIFNSGGKNNLRQFGALVNLCDVMVTGDTMAMHLAVALGKPTIALFGPTSHAEIEDYGLCKKLFDQNLDCLGCYLNDCDVRPTCMDRITVDQVYQELLPFLAAKR